MSADVIVVPVTAEMVPEICQLHLDAFAGYMNTRMGVTYIEKFIDWFRLAERGIAVVAIEPNKKIIGYALGAPLGYEKALNRYLLWAAIDGMIRRPWLFLSGQIRRRLMARLRVLLGFSFPEEAELPQPTMSLVAIGVARVERGRKVGLRLLQAFEERACELQMKSLRLSVYAQNTVARHLYERCGWQLLTCSGVQSEVKLYFRILGGNIPSRN